MLIESFYNLIKKHEILNNLNRPNIIIIETYGIYFEDEIRGYFEYICIIKESTTSLILDSSFTLNHEIIFFFFKRGKTNTENRYYHYN